MSQGRFIEAMEQRVLLSNSPWVQELGNTPHYLDHITAMLSGDLVATYRDSPHVLGWNHADHLTRLSPNGEVRWDVATGDAIMGIAVGDDGAIWTASARPTGSGEHGDTHINRYDETGYLTQRTVLLSGSGGELSDMEAMPNGEVVLLAGRPWDMNGYILSSGPAELSNGEALGRSAIVVVRQDGQIDTVIQDDVRPFSDIATTPDNQIIATRRTQVIRDMPRPETSPKISTLPGGITRYAADGAVVWDIQNDTSSDPIGLGTDATGAAYVALSDDGTLSVEKLGAQRDVAWTTGLGDLSLDGMSVTPDGHVFLTGGFTSHDSGAAHPWDRVTVLDQDGQKDWSFEQSALGTSRRIFAIDEEHIFLADRDFMASSTTWLTLSDNVVDGVLQIRRTAGDDQVTVTVGDGMVTVTLNSEILSTRESDISGIYCTLGEGNDSFTMTGDLPCTVYGNQGNDTIQGGSGADYLHGGQGNDLIWAGAGNDTILGGNGNDRLYGNPGDDSIDAGAGTNEYVRGGLGNDTLVGSYGNSTLCGCDGDDDIRSAEMPYRTKNSRTVIFGDAGNDTITTLIALDRVWGGAGRDRFVLSDAYNPYTVVMDHGSQDVVNTCGLILVPIDPYVLNGSPRS